jgi:hypothetical protein
MKLLSFYTVDYSAESPTIDGRLDDSCWKNAQVYDSYYVYWVPNPGPGKLKTVMRMLWNKTGLFLGIVNYDENIDKICAKYTTRDSADMWKDDCAELYFDPYADSVGFTKFTVNSLATIADMRQIDSAVKLDSWSASGVEVKTSTDSDAWTIEMFIPWSDLASPPHDGTVWKFCHARFAWSSGNFVGVTSSPGGNYNNTGNFGFLYFSDSGKPDLNAVGRILERKAAAPWCLLQGRRLLTYENGKLANETLDAVFRQASLTAKTRIDKIKLLLKSASDPTVKKKFDAAVALFKQYSAIKTPEFSDLGRLDELNSALNGIYWELKLNNLMNELK